jgi:hypothetical protein
MILQIEVLLGFVLLLCAGGLLVFGRVRVAGFLLVGSGILLTAVQIAGFR